MDPAARSGGGVAPEGTTELAFEVVAWVAAHDGGDRGPIQFPMPEPGDVERCAGVQQVCLRSLGWGHPGVEVQGDGLGEDVAALLGPVETLRVLIGTAGAGQGEADRMLVRDGWGEAAVVQ